MKPIFIRDKKQSQNKFHLNPKYNLVPCGKCPNCCKTRASAWSFRLMQQFKDKSTTSAAFITLTYATDHLPITVNGHPSIKKRDLQLFFKRLRFAHSESKATNIKYYAVGEYGGKLKRPHYHVILFNADIEYIQSSWGLGHVHYGSVNVKSVGYTLKYISEPYKNFKLNDDREKPFSLMSKKLGLGYISKMLDWHLSDVANRMYCNLEGGKKCTMPRYYKDKIYSELEREEIAKVSKRRFAEEILRDLFMFSNDHEGYDRKQKNVRNSKISAIEKHNFKTLNA